jgi:ABC-2 type transport system permease protein
MVFGIVALGVGLGAVYPDFAHQNIAEVSTGYGGLMYMIISALFIACVVVLEAGPTYILYKADVDARTVSALEHLYISACFFSIFLVNGVAVWQPMKMGVKALENLE